MSGKKMGRKSKSRKGRKGSLNSLRDDIRQMWYPPELRIARPTVVPEAAHGPGSATPTDASSRPDAEPIASSDSRAVNRMIAELASLLWYVKTKHFKRAWGDEEAGDDDPRVRRTLGRVHRCTDSLKQFGIEVQDPTGKRYPPGGEGLMKPLQFLPTTDRTFDVVSETIAPIIYRDGALIQRGEVLVAVPMEPTSEAPLAAEQMPIDHPPSIGPVEPAPAAPTEDADTE